MVAMACSAGISVSSPFSNCIGNQNCCKLIERGSKYFWTYPIVVICVWIVLYVLWGDLAFPGGYTRFTAQGTIILGWLGVAVISRSRISGLIHLPPLIGMLAAGLLLRNVPYINVGSDLTLSISSPLRAISVVILLTRGAFSVNYMNIKKFRKVVPLLVLGSCFIEAVFGGLSFYFVVGLPIPWAASMGCIISAMSGAAVMPYLLGVERSLLNTGLHMPEGVQNVLTIAKTACGLDAIVAICMTEFAFGFIFGDGNLGISMKKGPAEVALGGALGIVWGTVVGISFDQRYSSDLVVLGLFTGGVMSLLGLTKVGYPRGGPLGVFLGALIAINILRRKKLDMLLDINKAFDNLWFLFQPLLFGILGSRTDISEINFQIAYQGVICCLTSMVGRFCAAYVATYWSNLSCRERIFLAISWIPKGTVQAALGPVALETALRLQLGVDYTTLAYQIMNLATVSIILSSTIGSLLLYIGGPRILHKSLCCNSSNL